MQAVQHWYLKFEHACITDSGYFYSVSEVTLVALFTATSANNAYLLYKHITGLHYYNN